MNIYAGNLPHAMTDERLREVFEPHGEITSARIIRDRATGDSRGFGFVEMASDDEARTAIEALNGTDVDGRTARVNEARPPERGPRKPRRF